MRTAVVVAGRPAGEVLFLQVRALKHTGGTPVPLDRGCATPRRQRRTRGLWRGCVAPIRPCMGNQQIPKMALFVLLSVKVFARCANSPTRTLSSSPRDGGVGRGLR